MKHAFRYYLLAWLTPALLIGMTTQALWPALIIGPIVSLLIFGIVNAATQGVGNIIFKRGGRAFKGYSEAQAMAKNGQREEACRLLLDGAGPQPDAEALRVVLKIAIARPLLAEAAMSACPGLLRHPKVSAADKQEYGRILAEVSPDATGSKYQIASHIK